ncbi:TPA: cobalt transporter CbiM [Methanosarcina acetivorans]|uniref:Cobalamin biosynthesis protein n=3 Tax=Methanosarcina acetivorans TaxID=2214 RepID=Q8TIW7_METAC|nr:cobalt transporter CbiM [Methanosarcina acetivorans]AAM07372.1 cobalamin biosynthesis protein [Methanosarcina acetivorans C2A]HIH94784.1 cobalt transporter CbiM [Methanosarcina acetivorans]
MHIPDGYLGPSTFISFWIIMIPIWAYAGRKMRNLGSRRVPLLALASAFTFVIMMFNIPVPGGSSGHAVGGTVIAVVIGPWAAVIAISIALALQALMFGDGGLTAYAANCFFMAVLMPFIGYYTYKFISGSTDIKSSRRVIAIAIGAWLAITVSATLIGLVLGLQPILYKNESGLPLYMPYPLSVTVPAMFLEHAFLFSILEALVSALIFAYIQRADPSIFYAEKTKPQEISKKGKLLRNLTVGLILLIILTPLGLLVAGTAYGEWAPEELKARIGFVPPGLEKLSGIWNAPFLDYSLSSLHPAIGYVIAAIVGVLLCMGILYFIGRRIVKD